MQIDEDKLVKIGQGLYLAQSIIASTMRDHNIYPSVVNMAFISDSLIELAMSLPEHRRGELKARENKPVLT